MFRKPKTKGAIRQRKTALSDDENEDEVQAKPPPPRPTMMSFDADEGADSTFKLKKDTKKVEELKRQQKLEEEAEKFHKEEKNQRKAALEQIVKKEKQSKEEKEKKSVDEKKKYLEKYRDKTVKHVEQFEFEEHLDIDQNSIESKFSSIYKGIPDSRAVFEAKKRRERARNNDGYIPLDDTQKYKKSSKSERGRLIREDENDDSDEDSAHLSANSSKKFYSARDLMRSEEERKREEQEEFLERENGEIEETQRRRADSEEDEWERQQIQKAVSGRKIGQLRSEKRNTAKLFGHNVPVADDMEMDMDVDMDVEIYEKPSFNGPTNTGGVVKIEDILAKLKLRIQEREEALNFRREEKRKLEQNLEENRSIMGKLEMELPSQSEKFTMYQELRAYSRSLLECLNEKVAELNEIIDKKRSCRKAKTSRITGRRRMDMRDQHLECSQGKRNGEAVQRAAEREARRGRRRRERETTLSGISHEEGLSTDDEEPTHLTMTDQKTSDEVDAVASVLFSDALDEYSDMRKVLGRVIDWLAVDAKSFQDAYVYMCIPKLCSPYVRLEMLRADVLKNSILMSSMQWFRTVILAGSENTQIQQDHEILVELAPKIAEKVVIPYLIDLIKEEWDPMSLRQTKNLVTFCEIFTKMPNLNEKSKQFGAFLNAIRSRICDCISEDLFVPIFNPTALENPSCRQFHDRQFWNCVKLIKCINCLSPLISSAARFELIFDKIVNSHCVMALRTGAKNDISAERKTRGLLQELDDGLLMMGGMTTFRQLTSALQLIADAQKEAGRSYYKEIRKFLTKLER